MAKEEDPTYQLFKVSWDRTSWGDTNDLYFVQFTNYTGGPPETVFVNHPQDYVYWCAPYSSKMHVEIWAADKSGRRITHIISADITLHDKFPPPYRDFGLPAMKTRNGLNINLAYVPVLITFPVDVHPNWVSAETTLVGGNTPDTEPIYESNPDTGNSFVVRLVKGCKVKQITTVTYPLGVVEPYTFEFTVPTS